MIRNFLKGKFFQILLFCLVSFVAGGINGFLGTGGGIVLMYGLTGILKVDRKNALATTLCATIPISAIALSSYIKGENVDFSLMKSIWLFTAAGGFTGAFLVDRLNAIWLDRIFAILVIYSGTCMIFR